jgi:rsbT antagonist protein RsbS
VAESTEKQRSQRFPSRTTPARTKLDSTPSQASSGRLDLEAYSIPVLKTGEYLITSPQVTLHDRLAVQFKDNVLRRIVETKAKGLVLDVSAIDIVDSFLVRQIGEIATAAGIMGAKVVVVGIRPDVAMTLVEMGFEFRDIYTARDLEGGLEKLQAMRRK